MRILLADDQSKVRYALRALLERALGFEDMTEAADTVDLWQQLEAGCPDLVLLDWELPGPGCGGIVPELRSACPNISIIVLSAHADVHSDALGAGADGFVCKCDPPEVLLEAIRALAQTREVSRGT